MNEAATPGPEVGLCVGDMDCRNVEQLARYIFSDVAASYVRNLTSLGSWNDPIYRGPR